MGANASNKATSDELSVHSHCCRQMFVFPRRSCMSYQLCVVFNPPGFHRVGPWANRPLEHKSTIHTHEGFCVCHQLLHACYFFVLVVVITCQLSSFSRQDVDSTF